MISITELNKINLLQIKTILDNSGIIIFPTETVWGIGCKFDDKLAVEKLYNIKGRDFSNPLQIQLSAVDEIKKYTTETYDGILKNISEKFLPGPLSIVLKKKNVPNFTTSNLDTVSIRVSSCDVLTKIIEFIGYPLASTSCNKSGEPVLVNFNDIKVFAHNHSDVFISIDFKTLNKGSTIISLDKSKLTLLREGTLGYEEIKKVANI